MSKILLFIVPRKVPIKGNVKNTQHKPRQLANKLAYKFQPYCIVYIIQLLTKRLISIFKKSPAIDRYRIIKNVDIYRFRESR